ncbi:SLC13 family permease [Pediococcus pentosaceus]|uniref:SLC13 family permease n=2 Tax=Pediococcus pentosaceus TaxID=1255 RepID=UPI00214A7447|nr:SLC13 family permease [Pediococcus pentosaceus]
MHDKIMWIALGVFLVSCLLSPLQLGDINLKTIFALFALMVVVKCYEELHLLSFAASVLIQKATNTRQIVGMLVLLSFFSAMLLTNDVAIITLLPLLFIISEKAHLKLVIPTILITMAANLGSMLTPMGNPQNLFILNYYHLSIIQMLTMALAISLISLLFLASCLLLVPKKPLQGVTINVPAINLKQTIIAGLVTVIVLLGVFSILPLEVMLISAIGLGLLINYNVFDKVDYGLLITFLFFFMAAGNLSRYPILTQTLHQLLQSSTSIYLSSIFSSQIISNVPATILLSKFTNDVYPLFLGVNIGGLGTLVASLANLLAYKQFRIRHSDPFMLRFSILNLVGLVLLGLVGWVLIVFFE